MLSYEELCATFPDASACQPNQKCGFEFDKASGLCWEIGTAPAKHPFALDGKHDAPIIGGNGKYQYQYMPDLLQFPAEAGVTNCHGLVVDEDENIILTYQNDGVDPHCLIKWNPDGTHVYTRDH